MQLIQLILHAIEDAVEHAMIKISISHLSVDQN